MSVRSAKTQISLGICQPADAQADLSLRWAHTHFVCFVMSRFNYFHAQEKAQLNLVQRKYTRPDSSVGRGTGGHGFDPGLRHTKVVKNGTSCSSLGTQTYGVELGLVDPVSG